MEKTLTKSPESLIVEHLDNNGQRLKWLADKLQMSQPNLYFILKGKENNKRVLTERNRKRINEILGTDY